MQKSVQCDKTIDSLDTRAQHQITKIDLKYIYMRMKKTKSMWDVYFNLYILLFYECATLTGISCSRLIHRVSLLPHVTFIKRFKTNTLDQPL